MNLEKFRKEYRERILLIGEIATRWAFVQGKVEKTFGLACNFSDPYAAMAAIRTLSSGSVQFKLVEAALTRQFSKDEYQSLHSNWKLTRRKLDKLLRLRNDLAHSVTMGKPDETAGFVVQSTPSIHDIDADMFEEYRTKYQGKPSDFDFSEYAMAIYKDASSSLDGFMSLLEQKGKEEAERKTRKLADLRANAEPLTDDEIPF